LTVSNRISGNNFSNLSTGSNMGVFLRKSKKIVLCPGDTQLDENLFKVFGIDLGQSVISSQSNSPLKIKSNNKNNKNEDCQNNIKIIETSEENLNYDNYLKKKTKKLLKEISKEEMKYVKERESTPTTTKKKFNDAVEPLEDLKKGSLSRKNSQEEVIAKRKSTYNKKYSVVTGPTSIIKLEKDCK
jgi:hypothetical protein